MKALLFKIVCFLRRTHVDNVLFQRFMTGVIAPELAKNLEKLGTRFTKVKVLQAIRDAIPGDGSKFEDFICEVIEDIYAPIGDMSIERYCNFLIYAIVDKYNQKA